MSTRRYLLSKIVQAVLTLLFVLVFNFFLFRGLGDPTQLLAKQRGNLTPRRWRTSAQSWVSTCLSRSSSSTTSSRPPRGTSG